MNPVIHLTLLFAFALMSRPVAQTEWLRTQFVHGREGHALAEDFGRSRIVLFGGSGGGMRDDTWEWDGTQWTERQPLHRPPPRYGHGMAYDFRSGHVLLFGGTDNSRVFGDTWLWDGTDWLQLQPVHSPAPRARLAMTTDPAGGVVRMHGGWSNSAGLIYGDLWEWDGSDWTQRTAANSQPVRMSHAIAFDMLRGVTVLYGGWGGLSDTWEWNGTHWTQVLQSSAPGSRDGPAMAYSLLRGRTVLFGGTGGTGTWEWDGSQWRQLATAAAPSERTWPAMSTDLTHGALVLFGGTNSAQRADTWALGASGWSLLVDPDVPPGRNYHAFGYDPLRQRCVLFGGHGQAGTLSDTWELDGEVWQRVLPATFPSGQMPNGMAYDTRRGRMALLLATSVMAGGVLTLWEWDGMDWRQRTAANPPQATQALGLTFDERRGCLVVFGGFEYSAGLVSPDTWELDSPSGVSWRRMASAGPSARYAPALAYDPVRGVTLLFGGQLLNPSQNLNDTWQWDGTRWTQLFPTNSPRTQPARRMVWDGSRQRLVLQGWEPETWEWDGSDWLQRMTSQAPSALSQPGIAYDQARERVVLFGGQPGGQTQFSADRWQYRAVTPASHATYGRGCAGPIGIPTLSAEFGPWRGAGFVQRVHPPQPGVLLLGASRTAWAGLPLPFDLGGLGMPGCALRTSPSLVLPLLPDGSVAVAIPDDAALVGARFFNQAVQLAPGVNALGAIVSDAAAAVIGAR